MSTIKRLAPGVKKSPETRWSLEEIEPTLLQPDMETQLVWSLARLLNIHIPCMDNITPRDVLHVTADCASLFYPKIVPKTLDTQDRLNLIHSKGLLSLPRIEVIHHVTNDYEPRTMEDIAGGLCQELSVPSRPCMGGFQTCTAGLSIKGATT
ncbi:hypothetical protein BDZ89DRAFT_598767 [Hymenopellis radicata]|nr:hypothetical protein BDZ89DRAFT_598767 [Hymenopellis radicata]